MSRALVDPGLAVEMRRVTFRYPGAAEPTLRDVDLQVPAGAFVAVVGGNGSGKTTLCKTLNGLVPHFWNGEFAGEVLVHGTDTFDSDVGRLSAEVGYVYQDFQNQLVRPTVRDEVGFGPVNFGLADHRERVDDALEMLGIAELADSFVWQLSGGQAHLTALASVLALRPRIIVVDEPVAELDPERARDIYERLRQLNREHGLTVITIEHHAEFIAEYADSVVLMADGSPVWHLPTAEAMARSEELEAHGIPAPPVVAVTRALGVGRPALTVGEAALALEARVGIAATAAGDTAVPAAGGSAVPAAGDTVASLRGVEHGHRTVSGGRTTLFDGLDLDLRRGERVALVGGTGAGKTTLMKLLTGLVVPRAGAVVVDGVDTREVSPARMADKVAYLHQRAGHMFLADNVRGDVAMFPAARRRPDTDELVDDVLDQVRLTELAERDGRTLSGGQQRRATLAIGLAMRPRLLLRDEPTSSLDTESRVDVVTMLERLSDQIACSVVASHDMTFVAEWATRVLVLSRGRLLADTTPAGLFTDPVLMARARLVPPQPVALGLALGLDPVPLTVDALVQRLRPAASLTAGV